MTIKIDADSYDAITFDCYGTLIDWESGLMSYVKPLLAAHDAHAVDSFLLDFYGRTEPQLQSGAYRPYRQILENVLAAHPSVMDVAVFGIPDEEFGEQVKAAVELAPGRAPDTALAEELLKWCRARLAHLKCPKSIDFHAALPRHDTGKLYKQLLRDAYWPTR